MTHLLWCLLRNFCHFYSQPRHLYTAPFSEQYRQIFFCNVLIMLAYDRSTRADIACTSLTTDSDICCCGFRPVRVACSDPYKHLSVGEPCECPHTWKRPCSRCGRPTLTSVDCSTYCRLTSVRFHRRKGEEWVAAPCPPRRRRYLHWSINQWPRRGLKSAKDLFSQMISMRSYANRQCWRFHGYMRYGSDGALSLSPVMFLRDKAELFLVVLALRL